MTVVLRRRDGGSVALAIDDWSAQATPSEIALLEGLDGPVLDLGCGPGRLVVALAERGTPALGIDASPNAVAWARAGGAQALRHSLFEPLPGEGRWATVLLMDGNVGIGGDPVAVLTRINQLLAPAGIALVEVDGPSSPTRRGLARLERDGEVTPWFPWAWVAADALPSFAHDAGLRLLRWERFDGRWFAVLARVAQTWERR